MNKKIASDLRNIIDDAESILANTAHLNDEKITALRQKIAHRLNFAKEQLKNMENEVRQKTKQCADKADQYVNENPWKAVGIAGVAGLILGLLLKR